MEIHALKLLITQDELNAAAARVLPSEAPLRDVKVRLTAEGVYVEGVYAVLMGLPFETRWKVGVREGKLAARLAGIRVIGVGVGMLNGLLMSAVAEAAAREEALQVEGDTVLLDVDRLLARQGFPSRTNLTAVRCAEGQLWIEASNRV
ncbi:MAG TPA: hypothetical protein VNK04_26695 [Gemmataceae bacterium]|nr:hypothetical protein [Gemmataceae bacterium]